MPYWLRIHLVSACTWLPADIYALKYLDLSVYAFAGFGVIAGCVGGVSAFILVRK